MKTLSIIAILIFAISPVFSQTKQKNAEQEIERLEKEWNTANETFDVSIMERLLADDSMHIASNGNILNKKQDIENAKANKARTANTKLTYDIDEKVIRLYKNLAVVTGRGTIQITENGTQRTGGQFRFTHVWMKGKNGWQIVSDHTTIIRKQN